MSDSFELFLACVLKEDTPQQVVDILTYLVSAHPTYDGPEVPAPDVVPDHFFFEDIWGSVLQDAYFWAGEGIAKLTFDDQYNLTVRVSVRKGYDLITSFLHWLTPYMDNRGYVGYVKSDELIYMITLIFIRDDSLFYQHVNSFVQPPEFKEVKIKNLESLREL